MLAIRGSSGWNRRRKFVDTCWATASLRPWHSSVQMASTELSSLKVAMMRWFSLVAACFVLQYIVHCRVASDVGVGVSLEGGFEILCTLRHGLPAPGGFQSFEQGSGGRSRRDLDSSLLV